jgi:GTP-binding protein HflX
MKRELHRTDKPEATAVLVAVETGFQTSQKTQEYLDELEFLATTLGIRTIKTFRQKLDRPDPKTFVGKGKFEEITSFVTQHDVDVVIFDDDLTNGQTKNIDRILTNRLVIDRSMLILQIFSQRAQTAQAKTQVELAQYEYMLPRLTNLWSHHSRQRGGIGMRGPGESELETDKRIIRDKVVLLKRKLSKFDNKSDLQRKSRDRMVRVALVGYTNVGKSTLMNLLSRSEVFAENKLFATLDATVRKVTWYNIPFLLSDTVGFIRKLPTTLIEAFKSTLSEIVEADLLLHVVDLSHEGFEEQIEVVMQTLADIGANDKPMVIIFNKIDQFKDKEYPPFEDHPPATVDEWRQTYLAKTDKAVFISATKQINIEELKAMIFREVEEIYYRIYPNHRDFALNQYWRLKPEDGEIEE